MHIGQISFHLYTSANLLCQLFAAVTGAVDWAFILVITVLELQFHIE